MKIYTSYYAVYKKSNGVSIAAGPPPWFKGHQYKKLAPKYFFFKKWKENHNNQYYIDNFYEHVLNKLDASTVYEELKKYAVDDEVVLLCYERPEDFCHRHLVATWLSFELGIEVTEYERN